MPSSWRSAIATILVLCFLTVGDALAHLPAQFSKSYLSKRESPSVQTGVGELSPEASVAIPINHLPGGEEPAICSTCRSYSPMNSLDFFSGTNSPSAHGVELATGKLRHEIPLVSFRTRLLGFNFSLHYSSLMDYNGPSGQGFSHSFNMMIVRTGQYSGKVITTDLRAFPIGSTDGLTWHLPEFFYSRLVLDPRKKQWTITHHNGVKVVFQESKLNEPGKPLSIVDTNGNKTALSYDRLGRLSSVMTDLGQRQTLVYGADGRLTAFHDHIGRAWKFTYDRGGRLIEIASPSIEHAAIGVGVEIGDKILESVTKRGPRLIKLHYESTGFPNHLTKITDARGAIPIGWDYDSSGRVTKAIVNQNPVTLIYGPETLPHPLAVLDSGNGITRVIDRENNIVDYEFHAVTGGPLRSQGKLGLRRKVFWTEKGKGHLALRKDEPNYWEQRWLQDCDCLAAKVITQPFSHLDPLDFDSYHIPLNWPRATFEYNDWRQITREEYTDGSNSIITVRSYSTFEEFSRLLTQRDPRAFDDNPIYSGLDFTNRYQYDRYGNLISRRAPTVTRGIGAPQNIIERWKYNVFGQPVLYSDPNGNLITYTYFSGASSGGNINTRGGYGGYLSSTTQGATGSTDKAPTMTTRFKVNALGMITQQKDPKGLIYDRGYNELGEVISISEPTVRLMNGRKVRYESQFIYDGAGNNIMRRRRNIDANGIPLPNMFISRSYTFDDVNNVLSIRMEVDSEVKHDLVTRYAYNRNDQRIVIQRPEGNRTFRVYDERLLLYETLDGVGSGAFITEGYPTDVRADSVASSFIRSRELTYDSRMNLIQSKDGRGDLIKTFYDFANRPIARSDQNGNGKHYRYDDASLVLVEEGGTVNAQDGTLTRVLERSYYRFDELRRRYQVEKDVDPSTDESADIKLKVSKETENSNHFSEYDRGSRVTRILDANGNQSVFTYDAANRRTSTVDAFGNATYIKYDSNSNVVLVSEVEVAGPDIKAAPEIYVTTYDFDEVNRIIAVHDRGLNSTINHVTKLRYDSRHNIRVARDPEGLFVLREYDDVDRPISLQQFDRDPSKKGPHTPIYRTERVLNRNSHTTEQRTFTNASGHSKAQSTQFAYDNLERRIRIVYADSDDDINGSNGSDGIFERVELEYDKNSNVTEIVSPRGVVTKKVYDPGNRLVEEHVTQPKSVGGVTTQIYTYDPLNRLTQAANDNAVVERRYDSLSRLTLESQAIRLDGRGFETGWEHPINIVSSYDPQSNRTNVQVHDIASNFGSSDLSVHYDYDELNRLSEVTAALFDKPNFKRSIAKFSYFGPERIQHTMYGNGVTLTTKYDEKARPKEYGWNYGNKTLLLGLAYDYDNVDNPLNETAYHDNELVDNYSYNWRHELTGVNYRDFNRLDYRKLDQKKKIKDSTFTYDDYFNRTADRLVDPFAVEPPTLDQYKTNQVNEYVEVLRNNRQMKLQFDRSGNETTIITRPSVGKEASSEVMAEAQWDAFDRLFNIQTHSGVQHYRYDALGRRVAVLELSEASITTESRRYVYDGWNVVEERIFNEEATLSSAPSRMERVYVQQSVLDGPLLAAIDGDGDRSLATEKNRPSRPLGDGEYYFASNMLGSVIAIIDADDGARVLEYYRYEVFGNATVLPIVDENGDGKEDTPRDLTDNADKMYLARKAGDKTADRYSAHKNTFFFTGRHYDTSTGLYYYRHRYYDPATGRFISRDPLWQFTPTQHFYEYTYNQPNVYTDPLGLCACGPSGIGIHWANFTPSPDCPQLISADLRVEFGFSCWCPFPPMPVLGLEVSADAQFGGRVSGCLEEGRTVNDCSSSGGCFRCTSAAGLVGTGRVAVFAGATVKICKLGFQAQTQVQTGYDACSGLFTMSRVVTDVRVLGQCKWKKWGITFKVSVQYVFARATLFEGMNTNVGAILNCSNCNCCTDQPGEFGEPVMGTEPEPELSVYVPRRSGGCGVACTSAIVASGLKGTSSSCWAKSSNPVF